MQALTTPWGKFEFNGIRVHADPFVYWCSDWARIDELVTAGYLRREWFTGHGDPYAQFPRYTVTA